MGILLGKIIECVAPRRKKVVYELKEYFFDEHWYNPVCSCMDCYNAESIFNVTKPEDKVLEAPSSYQDRMKCDDPISSDFLEDIKLFSTDDIIGEDVRV